jgi:aminoglycoside 6'-N-acetyltransferase I
MTIEPLSNQNLAILARLTLYLWPDCILEEEIQHWRRVLPAGRETAFLAYDEKMEYVGFITLSLRYEYVEGTQTSPVGYVEGIWVAEGCRKEGVGRKLVEAGEQWSREKGCREMASDAELHNWLSQAFHERLGFEEVNRVVCYKKGINGGTTRSRPITDPASYIKNIRAKIGRDLLIHPAARIIIENDRREFLFIIRLDNGKIGLPAGALEENETIEECIIREVREETGLLISDPEVIGISTHPQLELASYPNGDRTQYFTIEFYINKFEGELAADHLESKSAAFRSPEYVQLLPDNEKSTFDSLELYRSTGRVNVR